MDTKLTENKSAPSPHLKILRIRNLRINGRIQGGCQHWYSFYPPADQKDWPQTTSDITDENLRQCLDPLYVGSGAIGRTPFHNELIIVLAYGLVWTEDTVFWGSFVQSEGSYKVVYGMLPG